MISRFKFLAGLLFDIGTIPIQIINTLLLIPIFISKYDSILFGNWISILSLITFFLFFDMGFGLPFTNEIKNGAKNNFISSVILLTILLSILASISFYFTHNFIFNFFKIDEISKKTSILISIYLFLEIAIGSFGCILNGKGHIDIANKFKMLGEFIYLLVFAVSILFDQGINSFIFALISKTFFVGLILFYYSKVKFNLFRLTLKIISASEIKFFLKDLFKYQTHRINETIYQSADNLIIQYFIGPSSVTIYNITSKLAVLFTRSLAPKITSTLYVFIAKSEFLNMQKNFMNLEKKFLRLGIMLFAICFFLNESTVNYFYSTKEYGGDQLNFIFSLWIFTEFIFLNSYIHVIASKKYSSLMNSSTFEMFTNLILSTLLVLNYGLVGVAFSTLISKVIFSYYYYYRSYLYLYNIQIVKNLFITGFKSILFLIAVWLTTYLILIISSSLIFNLVILIFSIPIINLIVFDLKILLKNDINFKQKIKSILFE